jgi:uncharacterized protein GlcG (DUF336 family)/catechol 2,3-dioxygenase-like lactoylglutathione lyase family enzyme
MRSKVLSITACVAAVLTASSVLSAGSGLPGDVARPGDNGVPRSNRQSTAAAPAPRPPPPPAAPALPIELAVQAAQAIAQACKQYPLGVAVVNSEGAPILVYIPDGSEAAHTYTAIRKAYTTVKFKVPTSDLTIRAAQDPHFAAMIKADPNLIAFKGGIPLKAGNDIIGAIGVSGAEPGGHDEECGMIGIATIKDQLPRAEPNALKLTPHHATISVADLDKESQWYASVLGFEKSNFFDSPDAKGCWMVIPGYRVDLIQQKGSSRKDTQIGLLRQGWLHVVFQTPMIEEALKRLQAAGTDVKAFKNDGHLQRLILHDPEGNEVELHT